MPSKFPPLPILAAALSLALSLFLVSPAGAEIYKWKDASGKTVISDKPPPGHEIQRVKPEEPEDPDDPDSPPKPKPAPKLAAPSQPSWTDREMDFRKRQLDAREKADKAAKEETAAAERGENCQNARRWLQTLESGQRISSIGDSGERQFMDDARREQEMEKARGAIETQCR